jgi:hypothetical protein
MLKLKREVDVLEEIIKGVIIAVLVGGIFGLVAWGSSLNRLARTESDVKQIQDKCGTCVASLSCVKNRIGILEVHNGTRKDETEALFERVGDVEKAFNDFVICSSSAIASSVGEIIREEMRRAKK